MTWYIVGKMNRFVYASNVAGQGTYICWTQQSNLRIWLWGGTSIPVYTKKVVIVIVTDAEKQNASNMRGQLTRPISSDSSSVGSWSNRSIWVEFSVRKLREIGHHRLLINPRVNHFFWFDQLQNTEKCTCMYVKGTLYTQKVFICTNYRNFCLLVEVANLKSSKFPYLCI